MERSIKRAIRLLGTPPEYDKYLSIKLSPPSGCCCSDCWPETWRAVNSLISPFGPVGHEGDALIGDGDDKYVLESHESGPEIIAYLALATVSTTLVKSIIDLILPLLRVCQTNTESSPLELRSQSGGLSKEESKKRASWKSTFQYPKIQRSKLKSE